MVRVGHRGNMQPVRSITCGEFYFLGRIRLERGAQILALYARLGKPGLLRKLNIKLKFSQEATAPGIPPVIRAIYGHCD